jgi:uroporphyrinogen-III synthase
MRDTVVVTASTGTFPGLIPALRAIPALVKEHPLLTFADPERWDVLDSALKRLTSYGAIVFTSPRAARAVRGRLECLGIDWPDAASAPRVWAGGPTTAAALEEALGPVHIPSEPEAARLGAASALARAMLEANAGSPVLFPCGEARRDELPEHLRTNGVEVHEAVCYRSVLASPSTARAAAAQATVLVVASPRVAELLAESCPAVDRPDLIAVGPTTAQSARAAGWLPAAVAELPTAEAVSAAVQSAITQRYS